MSETMMLTPPSIWLLAGLLAAAPAAASGPIAPTEVAGLQQALGFLGFDADERARLLRGEIVSHGIEKISETELAVTVAVITPHPMAEVIDLAQEHDPLRLDDLARQHQGEVSAHVAARRARLAGKRATSADQGAADADAGAGAARPSAGGKARPAFDRR